jgi:hypothetical protein
MSPFFIGLLIGIAAGGIIVAVFINNRNTTKTKALVADYEQKLKDALTKVTNKI